MATAIAVKQWGHDDLANDLAEYLAGESRMVWLDMQLGPAGSPRPDVYTIEKSFVRPSPTAYECKISVSDFRADVTAGKWTTYLPYAYRVIFAAPAGLIAAKEIPAMCGLILRHETAWRLAKKPTIQPCKIPQDAVVKLLIDGVAREGPKMRMTKWNNHDTTTRFARKFGASAARYVSDHVAIHTELKHAEDHRTKMLEQARKDAKDITDRARQIAPVLWAQLLEVLDLENTATKWDAERVIREIRNAKEGTEECHAIRQMVSTLTRIVEQNKHFLLPKKETGETF